VAVTCGNKAPAHSPPPAPRHPWQAHRMNRPEPPPDRAAKALAHPPRAEKQINNFSAMHIENKAHRRAVLLTALRLRVGFRHRIISRTGRTRESGNPLELRGFFTPPHGHRGALEERRRPFGDSFCVKRPVSEGRMALPNPFETKRKKAPSGASDPVRNLKMAERTGLISNLLLWMPLGLQGISDRRDT